MKPKTKLIITIILSLILIFIGASIIGDILYWILGNKINQTLFFIIHLILIYLLITILFHTKPGKYIEKNLFKKKKKSKKRK